VAKSEGKGKKIELYVRCFALMKEGGGGKEEEGGKMLILLLF